MSGSACCDRCGSGCGCSADCTADDSATLAARTNRAGLAALTVRIGDHGTFFGQALRGLSSPDRPALRALGTRDTSDPAIAWLDAWAVAADVLTFYRERFTNEGYLRTATESASLLELAREVGHAPRPGVAASVRLAYTLDPAADPVVIPAGSKAQNVPQPGASMLTYETAEDLDARAAWSAMAPRSTRIPALTRLDALLRPRILLDDASLAVRAGERVLFVFGNAPGQQVVREVAQSKADPLKRIVTLELKPRRGVTRGIAGDFYSRVDALARVRRLNAKEGSTVRAITSYLLGGSALDSRAVLSDVGDERVAGAFDKIIAFVPEVAGGTGARGIDEILSAAGQPPPAQLRTDRLLPRDVASGLETAGDKRAALLSVAAPGLARNLYPAWRSLPAVPATLDDAPQVFLVRTTTGAFGASAPQIFKKDGAKFVEWPLADADQRFAFLDVVVDGLAPDGYVLIDSPSSDGNGDRVTRIARLRHAQTTGRGDYGIHGKVSRLELVALSAAEPVAVAGDGAQLDFLRNTTYGVQSQRVTVAAEPIDDDVGGARVVLDRLHHGLPSGRWIIVSGERTDIVADGLTVRGIKDAELALVAGVAQEADPASPGDTPRTVLSLAAPLAYRYRNDATVVFGNVVRATHGETVRETIGSGDATVAFATVQLTRAPLTYVAAASASGVAGTQRLMANGAKLAHVDSLLDGGSADRVYALSIDETGAATATFGDGVNGARAPSGQENLRATYRVGLGASGNVGRDQITLLTSRPLGVLNVTNPLAASGGADRDGPDAIRANAPLAALSLAPLSRLVGVRDYEYFARRFAGIGDARSVKLSDGAYQCVHVTVAGANDTPLARDDDLVLGLLAAYETFGDPSLPVVVDVRERIALFLQANVVLRSDADVDAVESHLRDALLRVFSFARRRLAQSVYLSEAIAVMQAVDGVDRVDVDVFGGITEAELGDPGSLAAAVATLRAQAAGAPAATVVFCAPASSAIDAPPTRVVVAGAPRSRLLPAQLAYLVPGVPDTLVLNFS